jgi:hypothetical protein
MNKQEPNNSQDSQETENNSRFIGNLIQKATKPSTLIIGITAIALGAVAYTGVKVVIANKLPPLIEQQLSGILNRPVKIAALRNIALNGAEIDGFSIPATPNDTDRLSIPKIKVNFNLLPVIFSRILPVEITLIKPEVYLEQDSQGEWINLNLKTQPGKESISLDTKVNVREGKITAVPYQQSPLIVPVDGSGRYNPSKQKQVIYDFKTAIAAAKANIKGETIVDTGKTQAKVSIKDLILADLSPLIPQNALEINQGRLNANLDINLPSLKQINATRIQGKVSLQQVQAQAKRLPKPIEAISQLLFGGNKVKVEDTQGSVGDVVAQVDGNLNLEKGYDLDVKVLPFELTSLVKTLPMKMPVPLDGGMQADFKLTGAVTQPKLAGNINSTKAVQVDRTRFQAISTSFSADLHQFVLKNLQLKPAAGGQITGTGVIQTQIKQLSPEKSAIAWENMPMAFNFKAQLPTEKLVTPYYALPSAIQIGTINAVGKVGGTLGTPDASLNWQAPSVSAQSVTNISGAGEVQLKGKDFLVRNTQVKVGEGIISINGKGNLDSKTWQTLITPRSLPINPFLSEIKAPQLDLTQPIALQDGKINLAGTLDANVLDRLSGVANLDLKVASGDVQLNSKVNAGNLDASLRGDRLPIEKILTTLPIPVALQTSQVDISGKLKQLLSLSTKSPSLDGWQANANAKLAVADGTVDATGELNNNVWFTKIDAQEINSTLIKNKFLPNHQALLNLPNLNAKANFSGNLLPLLQSQFNTDIKANNLSVQLGNQAIDATGKIIVSKLANQFDLASNLDIKSNTDLETLPVRKDVLAQQKINLKGDADFTGKLQGKNLLSAPTKPGNLLLTGNLQLKDVQFNQISKDKFVNKISFDRLLSGNVNVEPGKDISLNLKGEQDIIAAKFNPCHSNASNPNQCALPYLPEFLKFQTKFVDNSEEEPILKPVVALGKRDRDNFSLHIESFPLAISNLSPATTLGLTKPIGGDLTGDLNLNLFNLSANGNINIQKPAIDYIAAKEVAADFNYDRATNIAQLTSASLSLNDSQCQQENPAKIQSDRSKQLDSNSNSNHQSSTLECSSRSNYNLTGNLNLNTGSLEATLDIPEAYIEDLLTTLRWFDLESATKLFQNDYQTKAIAVKPNSVETIPPTVSNQLNLLTKLEQNIQIIADKKQAGDIPTVLDIQGSYQGNAKISGTLTNPIVNWQLNGNKWRWRTQAETPAILNPLGLIKEGTQDIPIDRFNLQGKFADGIASLQPSSIKLGRTILSMHGELLPDRQTKATFNIKDLSVDFLRNFVQIPIDLNGNINSEINLKGAISKPLIDGNVTFSNAVINANALPGAIVGDFNYDGSRLEFQTTNQSIVQAQANVPYPIEPGTKDRFDVAIQLSKDTIALIDPLTQGQLSWQDGNGTVNLNAGGRIDLTKQSKVDDLFATGEVNLENATLKTKTFPSKIQMNGKILLKNSFIEVEKLDGKIAKRNFSIAGVLPIQEARSDINNPLTVAINKGKIEVENLYQGGIGGNIIVTGSALSPIVGGNVELFDGNATVPQAQQAKINKVANPNNETPIVPSNQNNQRFFVTRLDNFKVKLDHFKLEQATFYKVNLRTTKHEEKRSNHNSQEPVLTLNGTLDNPNNIKAKGTVEVRRADVDFLSNEFRLRRGYPNKIIFPNRSILNPDLDLQLTTQVSDYANFRQADINENEVPDSISKSGRANLIDVNLGIKGQASQLLASLGQNQTNPCQINPNNNLNLSNKVDYSSPESQAKLKQLETCIQTNTYATSSNAQILNAPIVKLTSTPPRSEGEIVSLLGNQFLELAKQLQNSNQDQLLEFGASQFVLKPITREATYLTDETINNFGRNIGLDYLRVYPVVQGVYELNKDSLVDMTYDYFVDEVKVRYQWRF